MNAPKLIFLDIDGTILGSDDQVSSAVIEQLTLARQSGAKIALATGRPSFGALHLIEPLGVEAPCVFFSGAHIYDPLSQETLFSSHIEHGKLNELIEFCRTSDSHLELYTEHGYSIEKENTFSEIHKKYLRLDPHVESFDTVNKDNILKCVMMLRGNVEQQLTEIESNFPDLTLGVSYGAAHNDITFVNISSQEASREACFSFITNKLDIEPKDIIAFGDGQSDIPFLKLAGTGVAMANAPEEVRNAADIVTKSVDEDGVAIVLKRILAS